MFGKRRIRKNRYEKYRKNTLVINPPVCFHDGNNEKTLAYLANAIACVDLIIDNMRGDEIAV
jgi:hypothetical protein